MTPSYDIAIVGSGFAGSLLGMIARRLGRSVALIEKGKHPRFAIGESSTPLSNLLLEKLAERYDLPSIKPLTKWGTWQSAYPDLACGLKRGFSFYSRRQGAGSPSCSRDEELLVAASPHDAIADTHWYRADVDRFFVEEARKMGVDYFDEVDLRSMCECPDGVTVDGERNGAPVAFRARFLVDATGPRGFVHRTLGLHELPFSDFPRTEALYTHFRGVARFQPPEADRETPYPADDAALHHVFDGGWIWVLRFNNGLTSAGVAATGAVADRLNFADGAPAWDRLLGLLPAVAQQFAAAEPVRAFTHATRPAFLSAAVAGARWALLPSAAAFVDPLLSTGYALTLLGVSRLAEAFEQAWGTDRLPALLGRYASQTQNEANAVALLIAALYANMDNFPVFTALTLLYFAAASFAEVARRLDKHHLAASFLLCEDPVFGPACTALCRRALAGDRGAASERLRDDIVRAIEPYNVAGLGDPRRRNWYPVDADDLLNAAGKLGANAEEIEHLLERSGFASSRESIHPAAN